MNSSKSKLFNTNYKKTDPKDPSAQPTAKGFKKAKRKENIKLAAAVIGMGAMIHGASKN